MSLLPLDRRFCLGSHWLRCRPRQVHFIGLGLTVALGILLTNARAADLVVDTSNSPYTVSANASYDNVYVGQNGTVMQSGSQLLLAYTAVPEPGTWMLTLTVAGVWSLVLQRRRAARD